MRRGLECWLRLLAPGESPALHALPGDASTRRAHRSAAGLHLPAPPPDGPHADPVAGVGAAAPDGPAARRWRYAAVAHAAAHGAHGGRPFERGSLAPLQVALVGVLEDARVERLALAELPGLKALWAPLHVASADSGEQVEVLLARLARVLLEPERADPHAWVAKARALFEMPARDGRPAMLSDPVALRRAASVLGNDLGQMRLRFDARAYRVEPSYRDDNAHLWEPDAAAADAPPDASVPPAESRPARPLSDPGPDEQQASDRLAPAGPVPEASASIHARSVDPTVAAARTAWYPEWDRLIERPRPHWCRVVETDAAPADAGALRGGLADCAGLAARLGRLARAGPGAAGRVRREVDGDLLDPDAAVDASVRARAGGWADERIYRRRARSRPSTAVLVLLDASRSTRARTEDGSTLIERLRIAGLLAAGAIEAAGDACALDAFCSNGRAEVRYMRLKAAGEPLQAACLERVAGLTGEWSTRLGAAVRHATARLERMPAERGVLLVVTDGAPRDIDVHDPHYLVEDARRAVREAAARGVGAFGVTLDATAHLAMRRIFGERGWRTLDRVGRLAEVLPALYRRLDG